MRDSHRHEKTLQDSKNRTETGQTNTPVADNGKRKRLPKTHQDYWYSKLSKRSYAARDGTRVQVPTWQVRLFHHGREGWFNLDTANQAAAAAKARDIYVFLKANGWDAALAKFKPRGEHQTVRNNLTVGEFLRKVQDSGQLRLRTFLSYRNSLRTILSEVFGIRPDKGYSKFDYRSAAKGNTHWTEKIDRIRLSRVTPDRINRWKRERLRKAEASPVALASAKRTVNSYVRTARSLFSSRVIKKLRDVRLPDVLPFLGVEMEEGGSSKYLSRLNVKELITSARTELKKADPDAYKVFLLALCAGMRKGEIDLLEWRMMDWDKSVIRLEETEWLHLKTPDSADEITVDSEVMCELKSFQSDNQSRFVVTSLTLTSRGKEKRFVMRQPRNDSASVYYRCEPVFSRLNVWLRSKGITAKKPLHELRKEVGALIATEHGIFAASRFLRHSDITTTARHYADHKTRISVGLGKVLGAIVEQGKAEK